MAVADIVRPAAHVVDPPAALAPDRDLVSQSRARTPPSW
jgi:hypothetical protein